MEKCFRILVLIVLITLLSACTSPATTPIISTSTTLPNPTKEPALEDPPTATASQTATATPEPPDLAKFGDIYKVCPASSAVKLEAGLTFGFLSDVANECYGEVSPEVSKEEGLLSHLKIIYKAFDGTKLPDRGAVIDQEVEIYINPSSENQAVLGIELEPTPLPTLIPTVTPEGYIPQIYIGITKETINNSGRPDGCRTPIYTTDYDRREGYTKTFWQQFPEIPGPGYRYRTRDQRRNMDLCIWPGNPIIFQMDEGIITDNRYLARDRSGVVLMIEITKGEGEGYELLYAHINSDTDPSTDEIEYLPVGTIVHRGDLIAFTDKLYDRPEAVLNLGICRNQRCNLLSSQEMMLIGPDGQLNLIRPDK